jgi:hypothetical protein
MGVIVHYHPAIAWHVPFAKKLIAGLQNRGIGVQTTSLQHRAGEMAILLGTTLWKAIEQDGGGFVLIDRCHYGDTDNWVALARNGRGYRARWPTRADPSRWEKYGQPLLPWRTGSRVVLCGQIGAYSPDWDSEESWFKAMQKHCTHFRPHPCGFNPTDLPTTQDWNDIKCAVVLNSSIATQTVMCGIPTVTMDKGSMAWPITGHTLDDIRTPEREQWMHWLAWCQWSHDEIKEGIPWDYLEL